MEAEKIGNAGIILSYSRMNYLRKQSLSAAAFVAVAAIAGCTAKPATGFNDPYESENRARHEFNRSLDKALVRAVGNGYAASTPAPVRIGVNNFADNFDEPGSFVNHVLQGNVDGAARNTLRFVVNSSVGVLGLFDAATTLGIPAAETDFGETLHVWGVPEGPYLELPVYGPSTERDAMGRFVDFFTNPLSSVLPSPEKYAGTVASVAKRIGDRGRFSNSVDSVLYDSADSYAQARLIYLQNRRYELGGSESDFTDDPYADPYGDGAQDQGYEDPYYDPYE